MFELLSSRRPLLHGFCCTTGLSELLQRLPRCAPLLAMALARKQLASRRAISMVFSRFFVAFPLVSEGFRTAGWAEEPLLPEQLAWGSIQRLGVELLDHEIKLEQGSESWKTPLSHGFS